MKKTKSISILLASLIILFSCLSLTTPSYAINIEIIGRSGFSIDYWYKEKFLQSTEVGEFKIQMDGFSNAAFCVELGVPYETGSAFLTDPSFYSPENSTPTGLQAAWLMDNFSTGLGFNQKILKTYLFPNFYSAQVYTSASKESDNPPTYTWSGETTKDLALATIGSFDENQLKNIADVALQLAIWEAIYDGHDNTNFFRNGLYELPKDLFSLDYKDEGQRLLAWALADMYLSQLDSVMQNGLEKSDFSGNYEFFIAEITNQDGVNRQNLIVAKPIPEPSTMLLFGVGLLGISAMGRKKS